MWGAKRDLPFALPLRIPEEPDLQLIQSEPHISTGSPATISFRNKPVMSVIGVSIRKEITETVTRGQIAGGTDELPQRPVAEIVSITQGSTTYVNGTDYILNGDAIDWSPSGNEPLTGSTMTVTYRYYDVVEPDEWDADSFTVSDAVAGSEIRIDYRYALPRTDSVVVDREGQVRYIKGNSVRSNPWPPAVPLQEFRIADVYNNWGSTPTVKNVGTRALHNIDIERNQTELQEVRDLAAGLMLQMNIRSRQPVTQRDEFVDPLRDDTMRDQGLEQTGAIVNEELQLPIIPTVSYHELGSEPIFLDFVEEVLVDQPLQTGRVRINPYDAFDPMPASLSLRPQVDHWVDTDTRWSSPETRTITIGRGRLARQIASATSNEEVGIEVSDAEFMRQIQVGFTIEGFWPGEVLSKLDFAGETQPVRSSGTPGADPSELDAEQLVADANGHVLGFFNVPPNVPAGSVPVQIFGAAGSEANAIYVANGEMRTTVLRSITTMTIRRWDPQAQSYRLDTPRQMTSVEFNLCRVGNAENIIVLEDRAMENGYPAPGLFGQAVLPISGLSPNSDVPPADQRQKMKYPLPVFNDATDERCIVLLTDDAYHEIGMAELGQLHTNEDGSQVGVTRQPYQIGVRFDGSNNSTWTAHQRSDLTFRILGARYTETAKTVSVAKIQAVNCSDLLVLVPVEEPTTETRVMVVITRENGEIIRSRPGQPIQFNEYLNEELQVDLELTGTEFMSPIVHPFLYIVQGELQASGDYITRAKIGVRADGEQVNHVVTFEANTPTGSSVAVEGGDTDNWSNLALQNSEAVGDDWFLQDYVRSGVNDAEFRTRISLTGSPAARPAVRLIRANTTPDPINIITGV